MLFLSFRSSSLLGFALLAMIMIAQVVPVMAEPSSTSGVVVETMNAADYTYLKVETNGQETWVAIPATPVQKGEQVTYKQGMVMENFASRTLGRTFASIVFSPGLVSTDSSTVLNDTPAEKSGSSFADAIRKEQQQPQSVSVEKQQSPGSAGATVPFKEINVTRAEGENSYTVEELFAKAAKLDGKTVRLRARVVKINPRIMGTNWIHLQDGTGDPMQNSHDLVATSEVIPQVDQVVVVEGKMTANKDFGFGYKYDALLEEAVFSTEE
ncbi:MAG: DNA-binding protein [Desulfocapsaceae bacterium]|nr:DNA-binding protein [Desulfocapsaceae bacterium]